MSPWAGKYRILGDGKGVIHARPSACATNNTGSVGVGYHILPGNCEPTTLSLQTRPLLEHASRAWFLTVEGLIREARHSREPSWREDTETTDLVILDDLGRTPLSSREISLVSGLIDLRYSRKLPIIVTTNLSHADLSERVGVEIVRRLWESRTRVTMKGIDRRMGGKHTDAAQLTG